MCQHAEYIGLFHLYLQRWDGLLRDCSFEWGKMWWLNFAKKSLQCSFSNGRVGVAKLEGNKRSGDLRANTTVRFDLLD